MNEPKVTTQLLPEKVTISFSIIEHKLLSFRLTGYSLENKNLVKFDGYEFQLSLKLEVLENEKIIKLTNHTLLFEKQSENVKQELAELRASFKFLINNFDELVKKLPNKVFEIRNPLLQICYNIAASSVRGMYSAKLDNTIYNNAILPIIDINRLVPEPNNIIRGI
ncbi:MAG: hypothetical protein ABIO55_08515 [Ginsengibacter sp.]